jgi:hypothetical protein
MAGRGGQNGQSSSVAEFLRGSNCSAGKERADAVPMLQRLRHPLQATTFCGQYDVAPILMAGDAGRVFEEPRHDMVTVYASVRQAWLTGVCQLLLLLLQTSRLAQEQAAEAAAAAASTKAELQAKQQALQSGQTELDSKVAAATAPAAEEKQQLLQQQEQLQVGCASFCCALLGLRVGVWGVCASCVWHCCIGCGVGRRRKPSSRLCSQGRLSWTAK